MRVRENDPLVVASLTSLGWLGALIWRVVSGGHTIAAPLWFAILLAPATVWLLGRALWDRWCEGGGK